MKRITLLLAMIIGITAIHANPVKSRTAQTVATNFYNQTVATPVKEIALVHTEKLPGGEPLYYIFNINATQGFVIVSADDAASPIIGYSNKGSYSTTKISPEFAYWMQGYSKQITYIKANNIKASAEIQDDWNTRVNNLKRPNKISSSVNPLLQTTWDQSPYYNALCPGGSVTGCVATAMSQIMRYWNYPSHGIGSSSYIETNPENYGTLSANYGATNYNWSNMPLSLTNNNIDVANLNYDAGVSVQMYYSPSGSGAWVICADDSVCSQSCYVKYFGYNGNTIQGYYRLTFSDSVWISMLENELNNARPVQYVGFGTDGGHTWVCDGYDVNNNFDMNWGWGGADDGYFSLNALNPSIPLDSDQEAVIGIQPLPIRAMLSGAPQTGCTGTVVNFTDRSLVPNTSSPVTKWNWSFPGGTPSSSNAQNPMVAYNNPGSYSVSLKVTNINGSDSTTAVSYINISNGAALPLVQGFEGAFPPTGWAINNPSNHTTTWEQYDVGGYGASANSIYYNNCTLGIKGEYDQVYTPTYDFTNVANPKIYFDIAYTPYNTYYSDTLAIYYSTDCGKTFTIVYLKGGMNLCTTSGITVQGGVNENSEDCFVPLYNNWRTDTITIPAIVGQSSVMFSFENRSGSGGNMFIDNINIPAGPSAVFNPADVNSIEVYPNPNNGSFTVAMQNANGKYQFEVYNMIGEKIYQANLNSYNTEINIGDKATGIYLYRILNEQGRLVAEGKLSVQ